MPDFEQPDGWTKRPHIVLVVDESGSMSASRETVVATINDYLGGLKTSLPPEARVTVVKFDSGYNARPLATLPNAYPLGLGGFSAFNRTEYVRIERLFDQVPLGDVRPLTQADYTPQGGTPLHDAIGRTINQLDAALAREPAPVYFAILTDGHENSSTEFTLNTVKQLIQVRRERGWTISFMGVDIDAYAASHSFGITRGDTVSMTRSTMSSFGAELSGSVRAKYATATTMAAGGSNLADYATWNETDATFKDEAKAKLEELTKP